MQLLKILPLHSFPGPLYPSLQVHVNEPYVFAHTALTSQSSVPDQHSSISNNNYLITIYSEVTRQNLTVAVKPITAPTITTFAFISTSRINTIGFRVTLHDSGSNIWAHKGTFIDILISN